MIRNTRIVGFDAAICETTLLSRIRRLAYKYARYGGASFPEERDLAFRGKSRGYEAKYETYIHRSRHRRLLLLFSSFFSPPSTSPGSSLRRPLTQIMTSCSDAPTIYEARDRGEVPGCAHGSTYLCNNVLTTYYIYRSHRPLGVVSYFPRCISMQNLRMT